MLCIVSFVILCIDLYEPKDSIGLNTYVCFVITTAVLIHTVIVSR